MGVEIESKQVIVPRRVYQPSFAWFFGCVFLLMVAVGCLFLFSSTDPFVFGLGGQPPAWMQGIGPPGPPPPAHDGCPRPQGPIGLQPGFNEQERDVRQLRRLAFHNEFFAQLELGRRYTAVRSSDHNIESPVEAAVWYAMAIANPQGYSPVSRAGRAPVAYRPSKFDDCRQWERHAAYEALDRLLVHMSTEEQAKVRNRIIFVLATLDADGYRTLSRIYDDQFGPFGEPVDDPEVLEAEGRPLNGPPQGGWHSSANLFQKNDVDAYLYSYLAMQTGDVSAYVMFKDFEHSSPDRGGIGGFVDAKAKRWVPPYEFYPPEAPLGGVPFSDESYPRSDDVSAYALTRMNELPFVHVGRALFFLGVTDGVPISPAQLSPHDVQTLQAMLGLAMDGVLTPLLEVRAVQYAAVNGSAQAQLVLAVMYEEGVGVPPDYARSFYWFTQADRQGSPEAKFAMASFFARGVEGVADQDKAKAVVLRLGSAMAGFTPSAARLQQMLNQVAAGPRPPTP